MSTAAKPAAKHPPRDAIREVVETVVFVVALVLMLKLFVVEAFVIPTGSMAETLLGYNKVTTCPDCGFEFPVNASDEADPQDGNFKFVAGATCPNCRYRFEMAEAGNPSYRSGDRVLVHKTLYSIEDPARGDVVVFKFPVDPQIRHTAQNYIKRLWGLGDDTIALNCGDLYVARGLAYPIDAVRPDGVRRFPRPEDPLKLWEGPAVFGHSKTSPPYQSQGNDFTYHNVDLALEAFEQSRLAGFPGGPGRFELLRKSDAHAISMRRVVYNNDFQSAVLAKKGIPPRWSPADPGWKPDSPGTPRAFAHSGNELGWVRYQHRISAPDFPDDWQKLKSGDSQPGMFPPSPITNFIGYNAGIEEIKDSRGEKHRVSPREIGTYWVGDLMIECTTQVSGPTDEITLELSKGMNRFQARFSGGNVTLIRTGPSGKEMVSRPSGFTSGSHELRFANFDCRLRVWVDGAAIDFGAAGDYSPSDASSLATALGGLTGCALSPWPDGLAVQNDIAAPVSLGAKGTVEFSKIVLWQDTFFTPAEGGAANLDVVDTFYVQSDHYLCLGDNSAHSSDSRRWGVVPKRLMLGKAVFVFAPFLDANWRPKFDRVGFIR